MTPLLFILGIALLFALLFAYETGHDAAQPRLAQFGLITWLVSGNWPAKVGAGLLMFGIGALLRYALINIDVPPQFKLGSGLVAAAVLGALSMLLKQRPKRRAMHLALAGAAFGIAYLTAYSAYGFFGYINDINALALLALVSAAAGVFAVSANVMSVAVLAMIGAYIAPKFAIGAPGPLPVYGYYLAASLLSLVMVTMRGWRPLIHLSFLFTLAGALFFGWSQKFYQPEHYALMQPLLLALAAVHLAMPLLERRHIPSTWLLRFDLGYFIALPMVAAILTIQIAPAMPTQGTIGLIALAMIWATAAAILAMLKRGAALRHALVAALLAVGAIACHLDDVPWTLLGLGLSVATLTVAPRLGWSRQMQEASCGAALLFGLLHVLGSILSSAPASAFLNEIFAQRILASALLGWGARIAGQRAIAFAKILGVTAGAWAALASVAELHRLDIDFMPQLAYGFLLGAALVAATFGRKKVLHPALGGLLMLAFIGCGWWAAQDAAAAVVYLYFAATPMALLAMVWRSREAVRASGKDFSPAIALALLPLTLLPWANAAADAVGIASDLFGATIVVSGAILVAFSAERCLPESRRWNERIQPVHFFLTAAVLISMLLFHIERGVWPLAFELLALSYLILSSAMRMRSGATYAAAGGVTVSAVVLMLQAALLRVFGPPGTLTIADMNHMQLPAVVSLMWAIFGAGLAWWGSKAHSRSTWSMGAALLAAAAVKLVLFDFGSLGQLGNILAMIAAGLVFLGVAWSAPIPPKTEAVRPQAERRATANIEPRPEAAPSMQNRAGETASSGAVNRSTGTMWQGQGQGSEGVNLLWFVLLGLGILIALSSVAWRQQARRNHALEELRQTVACSAAPVPPSGERCRQ